jgi:hypothetical protein
LLSIDSSGIAQHSSESEIMDVSKYEEFYEEQVEENMFVDSFPDEIKVSQIVVCEFF